MLLVIVTSGDDGQCKNIERKTLTWKVVEFSNY